MVEDNSFKSKCLWTGIWGRNGIDVSIYFEEINICVGESTQKNSEYIAPKWLGLNRKTEHFLKPWLSASYELLTTAVVCDITNKFNAELPRQVKIFLPTG